MMAGARLERVLASPTEMPAPTPAPPMAPQAPPIIASTGTTASGAMFPGAATSRSPPAAPARTPATPPPTRRARPLHGCGACRLLQPPADQRRHRRTRHGVVAVALLDDVREHELIAVTRDRADEARLARIVVQCAAQRPNGLAQRTIRDDDVVPDAIEDLAAVYRFVATLDEEDEQIEVTRDERQFPAVAKQQPSAW